MSSFTVILLPAFALSRLMMLEARYPMMFQVSYFIEQVG